MIVHLSEQEKFLALENKTNDLSEETRQHLQECFQCQSEIREQQEMDIALQGLTPQTINSLMSENIITRLLKKTSPLWLKPFLVAASIILFAGLIFLGFQTVSGTGPVDFSFDRILLKSTEWLQQSTKAPVAFWEALNWSSLKKPALWLFRPDSARIFFILIVLGFYAIIDQHIHKRFF